MVLPASLLASLLVEKIFREG